MVRIASKKTYSLLTGGLNNVDGVETINSTPNRTESPDLANVEYLGLGGLKTMNGNTQFGDIQSEKIVGGWEYTKGKNKYMMIALANGEVKRYNNTTEKFETVYTFPSKSDRVSFCNMNNGVVMTNGIDDLAFYEYNRKQQISGSVSYTTSDLNKLTGNDDTDFPNQVNVGDELYIGKDPTVYTVTEKDETNDKIIYVEPELPETEDVQYYGWKCNTDYYSYNTDYVTDIDSNIAYDINNGYFYNKEHKSSTINIGINSKLSLSSLKQNVKFNIPDNYQITLCLSCDGENGFKPSIVYRISNGDYLSLDITMSSYICYTDKKYYKITSFLMDEIDENGYSTLTFYGKVSDDGTTWGDEVYLSSVSQGISAKTLAALSKYKLNLNPEVYISSISQDSSKVYLYVADTKIGDTPLGEYVDNKHIYSRKEEKATDITNLYTIDTSTSPYTVTEYDYKNFSATSDTTFSLTYDIFQEEYTYDEESNLVNQETPVTTDLDIFYGPISQCNAILVNEDDQTVATEIRGGAIQFYRGRLWVGGDNGLFYAQVGQYNKWDIKYDAGVVYSIYNDTSEIKALGLYSNYMMVHKEHSTYILTADDVINGDESTLSVQPYSNVTCWSQQSWINSNTKYFVYSHDHMDIYPLMQHTVFADKFLGEPITPKVRNAFLNLRNADLANIFCVGLARKRWMIFYMPMVDMYGSGYGLIYDFQTKSFLVRKVPQEVTMAFNYDGNVYLGVKTKDLDGNTVYKVLREFDGFSFDGEAINSYYKTPWFDWSDGYTQSFAEFAIELDNSENNNFYIRTFKDGLEPHEDRIITSDNITSDSLIWDGDTLDYPQYYYNITRKDGLVLARIPNSQPSATKDIDIEVDNDVVSIACYRDEEELKVYTVDEDGNETILEQLSLPLYYSEQMIQVDAQVLENNFTKWDEDNWSTGTFQHIRMLLPNNVFDKFQIEIGTSNLSQAFAFFNYSFRRIETDEAPW